MDHQGLRLVAETAVDASHTNTAKTTRLPAALVPRMWRSCRRMPKVTGSLVGVGGGARAPVHPVVSTGWMDWQHFAGDRQFWREQSALCGRKGGGASRWSSGGAPVGQTPSAVAGDSVEEHETPLPVAAPANRTVMRRRMGLCVACGSQRVRRATVAGRCAGVAVPAMSPMLDAEVAGCWNARTVARWKLRSQRSAHTPTAAATLHRPDPSAF